ncbi:MAG: hypothetical protein ACREYF_21460, partial [Gammaproteobacteria bacterium]
LLDTPYRTGVPKMMLSAEQTRTLPEFFAEIPDPRRAQGRRHPPLMLDLVNSGMYLDPDLMAYGCIVVQPGNWQA